MYEQWKLGPWSLGPAPRTGLRLQFKGPPRYIQALRAAFPTPVKWYGPYESYDESYDWVLFIQEADESRLREFLAFLDETLLFPTTLDECWAVSGHMADEGRTEIGELVFRAKTYGSKQGDPVVAQELSGVMVERFRRHPRIAGADLIVGIPANPPKIPHNLPELLARHLSDQLGIVESEGLLVKTRETRGLKDLSNPEKLAELEGAYAVTKDLSGKAVVLVDDLLFSGSTISYVGQLVRDHGARYVIGIAATKTRRT